MPDGKIASKRSPQKSCKGAQPDLASASCCAQWVTWWSQLLTDVVADPASKNRVMVDLMNEPDVRNLK
jgi:hypothetical protein